MDIYQTFHALKLDILKIKHMVIKFIPKGYVNNYDKNRYLEKNSKAAVVSQLCFCLIISVSMREANCST